MSGLPRAACFRQVVRTDASGWFRRRSCRRQPVNYRGTCENGACTAGRLTVVQYATILAAYCRIDQGRAMEKMTFSLAASAAEHLGGADAIGREVLSDADMAQAVATGFTVATIDALKRRGITDREVGSLIIQASHPVAPPGEPAQADRRGIRPGGQGGPGHGARREDLRQPGKGRSLGFTRTSMPLRAEPPWS